MEQPADYLRRMAPTQTHAGRRAFLAAADLLEHDGARPGVMHPVDQAFHDLAIKQRDLAWRQLENLGVTR